MNQLTVTRLPSVARAGFLLITFFALVNYLSSIAMTLEAWRQKDVYSMQLAHIDLRTLRDIGISESQRFIEVNKSYWEK